LRAWLDDVVTRMVWMLVETYRSRPVVMIACAVAVPTKTHSFVDRGRYIRTEVGLEQAAPVLEARKVVRMRLARDYGNGKLTQCRIDGVGLYSQFALMKAD
jgi:hypothetical protein